MKLEIKPVENQKSFKPTETAFNEVSGNASEVLKRGIEAANSGNRHEARTLLMRVTETDPKNETAWLWLASISDYPEELFVFLQNVLAGRSKQKHFWQKISYNAALLLRKKTKKMRHGNASCKRFCMTAKTKWRGCG
jgi:hypothetical protein